MKQGKLSRGTRQPVLAAAGNDWSDRGLGEWADRAEDEGNKGMDRQKMDYPRHTTVRVCWRLH